MIIKKRKQKLYTYIYITYTLHKHKATNTSKHFNEYVLCAIKQQKQDPHKN